MATGLMFPCGLATTLNVVFRCNTFIRPEFVRCALVACCIKYVRLLAITLGIAICCNTVIRSEFVCYVLMTHGQVFVCCSTTTLSITIRCDTTNPLKSIRCVLAVFRLLPICRTRLRLRSVLALRLKSARQASATIGLFPVRYLFVIFW